MSTPTNQQAREPGKEATALEIDGFGGQLVEAGHAEYATARAVWNGAIDRHPRLIARCGGAADVVAAVRFARNHNLEVAVRGGGHNVAGTAVCDDGLLIDLSTMRSVLVDPAGTQPGCRAVRCGATSITRPRPTALPLPAAS